MSIINILITNLIHTKIKVIEFIKAPFFHQLADCGAVICIAFILLSSMPQSHNADWFSV